MTFNNISAGLFSVVFLLTSLRLKYNCFQSLNTHLTLFDWYIFMERMINNQYLGTPGAILFL